MRVPEVARGEPQVAPREPQVANTTAKERRTVANHRSRTEIHRKLVAFYELNRGKLFSIHMRLSEEGRRKIQAAMRKRNAAMPREERVAQARRAGLASIAKKTPEERRASAMHAITMRWARVRAAESQAA